MPPCGWPKLNWVISLHLGSTLGEEIDAAGCAFLGHMEIDDGGHAARVGLERALECGADVVRLGDLLAAQPQASAMAAKSGWTLKVVAMMRLPKPRMLAVIDGAQRVVVEHAPGDGQPALGGDGQHVHDHLEGAVADEAERR